MVRRGFVTALIFLMSCMFFGYVSTSAARGDSTPAPMNMNDMQPHQIMQNPDSLPASPESGTQWSVFNHQGAGFFILLWGLTALIAGLQWPRRTWLRYVPPLALLGLVEFLILRNDPKAWPFGPYGFWISFRDPSVLEHRVFVLLLFVIAIVELLRAADLLPRFWRVFAIPGLAVFGGVYLFFHHHGGLAAQHMMAQMSDPGMASNPAMKSMMASMSLVKREHLWISVIGFGFAAAKLMADGGLIKGRLGATLWTLFAIALGVYLLGYAE